MKMLILLVTMFAFSQDESFMNSQVDSTGAGNGNLNRDILDYEAVLTKSQNELKGLEEIMENLSYAFEDSKLLVEPITGTNDEFWEHLSKNEHENLKKLDQYLLNNFIKALHDFEQILANAEDELSFIERLKKDMPHFQSRGVEKKFIKSISDRRENLLLGSRAAIARIYNDLTLSIISKWILNLESIAFFNNCEHAVCLDIVKSKISNYFDYVLEIGNIEINAFGEKSRFVYYGKELNFEKKFFSKIPFSRKIQMKNLSRFLNKMLNLTYEKYLVQKNKNYLEVKGH